jgi:aldose 1-epimerase
MKINNWFYMILITGMLFSVTCKNRGFKKEAEKTEEKMEIIKEPFGTTPDGQEIDLYTLSNNHGMVAKITNYGGILTSLRVPDKDGNVEDVVLGFDNLQSYLDGHPYFGAIVGRYGNRIANGKFTVDGIQYTLAVNNGENLCQPGYGRGLPG